MTLPLALVLVAFLLCGTAWAVVLTLRPGTRMVPPADDPRWLPPTPPQPIGAPAASARQADELERRIAALEARVERQDAVIAKGLQEMRGMMEPLREEIVRAQNKQRDARN